MKIERRYFRRGICDYFGRIIKIENVSAEEMVDMVKSVSQQPGSSTLNMTNSDGPVTAEDIIAGVRHQIVFHTSQHTAQLQELAELNAFL